MIWLISFRNVCASAHEQDTHFNNANNKREIIKFNQMKKKKPNKITIMWRCATRNTNYFDFHPKRRTEFNLYTQIPKQSLQKYCKKVHRWAKVIFSNSECWFIFFYYLFWFLLFLQQLECLFVWLLHRLEIPIVRCYAATVYMLRSIASSALHLFCSIFQRIERNMLVDR